MMRGKSIHVGVKAFHDFVYRSLPDTVSCAHEAKQFADIADDRGFVPRLFTGTVSYTDVRNAIKAAAETLERGDYFLLTIATHGFPEFAGQPRAWCFSDAKVDRDHAVNSIDSIEACLRMFDPGVRIMVVANCCFAGSKAKSARVSETLVLPEENVIAVASKDPRFAEFQNMSLLSRVKLRIARALMPAAGPRQYHSHVYELAACDAASTTPDGPSQNEMTGFGAEVFAMVKANAHSSFTNFMNTLRPNCTNRGLPAPQLTPFPVAEPLYEAVGPYRVI